MYDHIEQQRARSEQLARHFSDEATHQWRKALTGFIALPTAIALGIGAGALYVAAFVERGFEIFQRQAEELKRNMEDRRETGRTPGEPARPNDQPRA